MLPGNWPEWLNMLMAGMQQGQAALLQGLHRLGLVDSLYGQPAWPWPLRLTADNLLIDQGQARRVLGSLAVLAGVAVLVPVALAWRRTRPWLAVAGVVALLLAPWPDARLLLAPASPTSFHQSPTAFGVEPIARGEALYRQHCTACHGVDGRGHGAQAAAQPVWPPDFSGSLLWRRADGDLLWAILHGLRASAGKRTTPHAFSNKLQADDAWALIDFLKAQSAGAMLRQAGQWMYPVRLPDMVVRCAGRPEQRLRGLAHQRMRVVAGDASGAQEDPRWMSLHLPSPGAVPASALDCAITSPEAWRAMRLIAGSDRLDGLQWLSDRRGWLRAQSRPGQPWSDDDLICSTGKRLAAAPAANADGIDALIARMDAEPVQLVKGGFVHR